MLAALALAAALTFPDVAARDLDGHAARPSQLRGAPAVFALGFSYQSRHEVEPWTRWLVEATGSRLPVVVMPVIAGVPDFVRGLVAGAMARETAPPLRRYVWLTAERDALVRGLALGNPKGAVLALVDARGNVRHLATGAPTPGGREALLAAWRGL
jgi:hypothetical protein